MGEKKLFTYIENLNKTKKKDNSVNKNKSSEHLRKNKRKKIQDPTLRLCRCRRRIFFSVVMCASRFKYNFSVPLKIKEKNICIIFAYMRNQRCKWKYITVRKNVIRSRRSKSENHKNSVLVCISSCVIIRTLLHIHTNILQNAKKTQVSHKKIHYVHIYAWCLSFLVKNKKKFPLSWIIIHRRMNKYTYIPCTLKWNVS